MQQMQFSNVSLVVCFFFLLILSVFIFLTSGILHTALSLHSGFVLCPFPLSLRSTPAPLVHCAHNSHARLSRTRSINPIISCSYMRKKAFSWWGFVCPLATIRFLCYDQGEWVTSFYRKVDQRICIEVITGQGTLCPQAVMLSPSLAYLFSGPARLCVLWHAPSDLFCLHTGHHIDVMDDTKTYSHLIPFCLVITAYERLF